MKRRSPGSFVVSTIFHVLAIAGLAHVLSMPSGMLSMLEKRKGELPVERIGFVSIPRSTTGQMVAGVSGGDGRPERRTPAPAIIAPREVPRGIPAAPEALTQPVPETGSGPLVGTGGPRRGVRPEYHDPRLWRQPTPAVTAPKSVRETIDGMIAADVARITDSVVAAGPTRAPGDWTVERNGRKYGIDPQFIRLGPVSIPTTVLALLPVNAQANPNTIERDRALNYMKRDIDFHARRAISEDEFRRNVRNLRERKDRERAERGGERERERQETTPTAPQDQQTR